MSLINVLCMWITSARGSNMSKHFKKVKGYFGSGLWSIERVRNAVIKGWITAEKFKMITGEVYGDDD